MKGIGLMKLRTTAAIAAAGTLLLADGSPAGWQTFDSADGLPQNPVQVILGTTDGRIWFGTEDSGLSRFDGLTWTTFTSTSTGGGLVDDKIEVLYEDRARALWAGTTEGLSRFDGSRWQAFSNEPGLPRGKVRFVIEDVNGNLWASIDGLGISRRADETWTHFGRDALPNPNVTALLVDHTGTLWAGTESGVIRFDATSDSWTMSCPWGEVTDLAEDRAHNLWAGFDLGLAKLEGAEWIGIPQVSSVLTLEAGADSVLWVGSPSGLWRHRGETWQRFTVADGMASNRVQALHEDVAGRVWTSDVGNHGVSRYDGIRWSRFTAEVLGDLVAQVLASDANGDLWVGTTAGVARFDRSLWETFQDPATSPFVECFLADNQGGLWFGTANGIRSLRGGVWQSHVDDLPPEVGRKIQTIHEDPDGSLWFGSQAGALRLRGNTWEPLLPGLNVRSFERSASGDLWIGTTDGALLCGGADCDTLIEIENPIPDETVYSILRTRDDALWLGTTEGVLRYDGVEWEWFNGENELGRLLVRSILEHSSGDMWFAGDQVVARFDGANWIRYPTGDGLLDVGSWDLHEDAEGYVWVGTREGASRYSYPDQSWIGLTRADGLNGGQVLAVGGDTLGNLWFGTNDGGVAVFEPDHSRPKTLLYPGPPPPVSSNRLQTLAWVPAYAEGRIDFSFSFDNGTWTPAPTRSWTGTNLSDGSHTLRIRARDYFGNVESPPLEVSFEIDATPPAPVLAFPAYGDAVAGVVAIRGTSEDARYSNHSIEVRTRGSNDWRTLSESNVPVTAGVVAEWETPVFVDGFYELRLSVRDTLGLVGTASIEVQVDTEWPFADVTSPAKVSAADGGRVYTLDGSASAFFAPRGLSSDAVVNILPLDAGAAPDSLRPGTRRLSDGYEVHWETARLTKPAQLTLVFSKSAGSNPNPAIYVRAPEDSSAWTRLGGTWERDLGQIATTFEGPGDFALYGEEVPVSSDSPLASLTITPRVLSMQSTAREQGAAVGFVLGRSSQVRVCIFDRTGRLIQRVSDHRTLGPGRNVVLWNGRDREDRAVSSGLYFVTVEAEGHQLTETLAVTR